jgi:hypothetical protein
MLLQPNIKLHQCCPDSPRRPAGRPITAHLLRWQLVDIPYVLSTSLPPCTCTILERSRIQDLVENGRPGPEALSQRRRVEKIDGFARKNRKLRYLVIPLKGVIQSFRVNATRLGPGFRRGDDFLRIRSH